MTRTGKYWLLPAPVLLCLLDHGLTLGGQPAAYWAGDYARAEEGNPVVRWCLEFHPAASFVEVVLWIALFSGLVLVSPGPLAKVLALGVALGHVVGSAMWLWLRYEQYWLFPVVLLSSAVLIVWTWERAAGTDTSEQRRFTR